MSNLSRIGLAGLAVMGQNLALNIADKRFPISVYSRTTSKVDETVERAKKEENFPLYGFHDPERFVQPIQKPVLVKAGAPIKTVSVMEKGDCIIDGGNESYENTERREKAMAELGLYLESSVFVPIRPRYSSNFSKKVALFPLLARVFRSLSWKAVWEVPFSEAVKKYGFAHSIEIFGTMVHIFSSAGMGREVYSLVRQIVCCFKEVNYDAFELFPTLLNFSNGMEYSAAISDNLIKVFASYAMLENAVDVFLRTKDIGLEPNVRSCNFLLKCLIERNQVEFVQSLFDEMKNNGPQPNVWTYTILMNFYFKGDHRQGIGKAKEILEELERCGLNPTVETYGTFIGGLCRTGDVESALDFLRDLRHNNKVLNTNCYNEVIHGFCHKGELYEAKSVVEEMKSYGILPDAYSYNILIEGFCKKGNISNGMDLLIEMKNNDLKPDLKSYSPILDGICKSGQMKSAQDMWDLIDAHGFKLDQIAYNSLIDGFGKQGDLVMVHKVFQKMIEDDLVPDVVNYTSILHSYCKSGCLEKALELYKLVRDRGIYPNTVTCSVIVDGYCKEGRMDEAFMFMDEMQNLEVEI